MSRKRISTHPLDIATVFEPGTYRAKQTTTCMSHHNASGQVRVFIGQSAQGKGHASNRYVTRIIVRSIDYTRDLRVRL